MDVHTTKNVSIGIDPYPYVQQNGHIWMNYDDVTGMTSLECRWRIVLLWKREASPYLGRMTTAIFRLVHYFNSARKSMLQSPALPIPNDCHMICQDVCSFWVPCHLFQGGRSALFQASLQFISKHDFKRCQTTTLRQSDVARPENPRFMEVDSWENPRTEVDFPSQGCFFCAAE